MPTREGVPARPVLAVLFGLVGAVVFLILALADPDPSRHARGLLVVLDLVGVLGIGTAWIRVVRIPGVSAPRERVE